MVDVVLVAPPPPSVVVVVAVVVVVVVVVPVVVPVVALVAVVPSPPVVAVEDVVSEPFPATVPLVVVVPPPTVVTVELVDVVDCAPVAGPSFEGASSPPQPANTRPRKAHATVIRNISNLHWKGFQDVRDGKSRYEIAGSIDAAPSRASRDERKSEASTKNWDHSLIPT